MSKEATAFADLVTSLKALAWLSVYTEAGKAGARSWSLEISRGNSSYTHHFGSRRIVNGYNFNLTSPGNTAPSDLSDKLRLIDDAVTTDRRRGGSAQTTIFDEEGWTVGEDEGRESFNIQTSIEIHINEVA